MATGGTPSSGAPLPAGGTARTGGRDGHAATRNPRLLMFAKVCNLPFEPLTVSDVRWYRLVQAYAGIPEPLWKKYDTLDPPMFSPLTRNNIQWRRLVQAYAGIPDDLWKKYDTDLDEEELQAHATAAVWARNAKARANSSSRSVVDALGLEAPPPPDLTNLWRAACAARQGPAR